MPTIFSSSYLDKTTRRRSRRLRGRAGTRGTVLVIVMVTMLFAAFALIAFMDKATNDLLVDHRAALTKRLRREAYSALEVTLAVLEDFRSVGNGLHSPAEGWGEPLKFAGYTPQEDRVVEVAFEDESGKISLPRANAEVLKKLFESWNVPQADAEMLTDAMLGWMQREHVYSTAISPNYETGAIPFEAPARPMRSYSELAAIDKVREFFYEPDGRPNENWRRFVASVSLFDFARSNINGARSETLAAVGQYDSQQQQQIGEYLSGKGQYQMNGPGYFKDTGQTQAIVGQGGNAGAFGTTISALRIMITVHEGKSTFRLSAVVTTANGARAVRETATSQRTQTSASSAQSAAQRQAAPNANQANPGASGTEQAAGTAPQNLRYPFTLLEIQENDEIAPAPSPPPENPTT